MVLELCGYKMTIHKATNSATRESTETGTSTHVQLSSKVVLFDDDDHSYEYVVEMLTHCCEMSRESAFYCAVEVDTTGRTIVFFGDIDACNSVCNKILTYGPDHRMPRSMGSMIAEVQKH